jgi:hypothetical protein
MGCHGGGFVVGTLLKARGDGGHIIPALGFPQPMQPNSHQIPKLIARQRLPKIADEISDMAE